MTGSMRPAYGRCARCYDVLSGEPVYRAGRVAGVRMLGLRTDDVVLDLGCGTGLNFRLLVDAVGADGRVIGLDRSSAMLEMARRRVARHGWTNVSLVQADATDFGSRDLGLHEVDAVIATYAMSVFGDPSAAWANARAVLRPGGRACIVDMQVPTGAASVLAPLARLACALGGADIEAHPWRLLEAEGRAVRDRSLRGGHIRVVAGTVD
jgi:ubiquinone/menaquinone biosynthesis C-methylase UbiE